jgi:hypothetical protein
MRNDFVKNNNLKDFEKKMLSILDHVSPNWGMSYQYVNDENDWYNFIISCQDDNSATTGVSVCYRPNNPMLLEVHEWDDAHYEKSVETILSELKKIGVKL